VAVRIITTALWSGQRGPRLVERAPAAVGCGLLLGALGVRTELWLLALLGGGGIALVGWSATRADARRLWRFGLLNAVLLGVLVWAGTERSELQIEVAGDRVTAMLGSARLVASAGLHARGGVALSLAPTDSRPLAAGWTHESISWLEGAALWLASGLRSGVEGATVESPDGRVLAGASPLVWQPDTWASKLLTSEPLEAWSLRDDPRDGSVIQAGDQTWRNYRLSVSMVRPGSAVRALVRADDGGGGLVVMVGPDDRSFSIEERVQGRADRTIAGGLLEYKRDALGWLQALSRELLRTWLFALVLVAAARAVSPDVTLRSDRQPKLSMSSGIAAAGLFAALALTATGAISYFVLERIPHVQDGVTYLFQAQLFALGRFSAPAPALPEFFDQEFIVQYAGQWFGKYPPGQPLVLAPSVLVGAPWVVSPLAAGGAIALTYLAGRRIYGSGVATLAAILMLSSPFFLFMSGSMMAHPAGLFWTSLLLLAAVLGWQTESRVAWVMAGAAFGIMFITRQLTAIAVGAPLLAVFAARLIRDRRCWLTRSGLAALGLAPPIAFLLLFNWQLMGDPLRNPFELGWQGHDVIGFGPEAGIHGGHDLATGLANTWANTLELFRHLYGWPPYLTLAAAAVPIVVLSRTGWDWVLAASFAALVGAYVFYWADGIMFGPRYYYEALGMLALLSARGFALLTRLPLLVGDEDPKAAAMRAWRPLAPRVAVAAFVTCLLAIDLLGYLPAALRSYQGFNGIDRSRLDLVERAELEQALVFGSQQWPDWQPYGSVFPANGPLLNAKVIYARDLGLRDNGRLMRLYPERRSYLLRGDELIELSP